MFRRSAPKFMVLPMDEILSAHAGGKLSVQSARPINNFRDMSLAYTPGVAQVCRAIVDTPELARTHTGNANTVAIISDGTAVLGLGNIGAKAALPVLEGKAQLFNAFGGLNGVPIALNTTDTEEIIATIKAMAPSFGAINLEDISAPRCFEIERRLEDELDIPVMHDDQHGTAIVITAALRNAARVLNRELSDLRVVVSGAGAAGVATVKMLLDAGVTDIVVLDSRGVLSESRQGLNEIKRNLVKVTNPRGVEGLPIDALSGADVFIGLSRGKVSEKELQVMAGKPILFSLANPDPEIDQELALRYGGVVATGRSDYPNQINNVLAFPGIFKGALMVGATHITDEMKLAASKAIADIAAQDLDAEHIVPSALDDRVCPAVAYAVADAWTS
ncbi:NAD(P)-dependent malic enzyme [Corynebacterium uterequi]|uniref:Malic enzyme n=1 Tax=Corynebacterium uterequi TaxID=1072256 RepID=A0A0G3HAK1_9CORY|nr:NADP-dependent malic enzyme [Corynebacterium uterequi]AKK10359.1 malic enzyme [Corynebacterium uterequi]